MARTRSTTPTDADMDPDAAQTTNGDAATRPTVPQELRPLFNEVARLSATLGIARRSCYEGDGARATKALQLMEKQLPMALEMAALVAPSE